MGGRPRPKQVQTNEMDLEKLTLPNAEPSFKLRISSKAHIPRAHIIPITLYNVISQLTSCAGVSSSPAPGPRMEYNTTMSLSANNARRALSSLLWTMFLVLVPCAWLTQRSWVDHVPNDKVSLAKLHWLVTIDQAIDEFSLPLLTPRREYVGLRYLLEPRNSNGARRSGSTAQNTKMRTWTEIRYKDVLETNRGTYAVYVIHTGRGSFGSCQK